MGQTCQFTSDAAIVHGCLLPAIRDRNAFLVVVYGFTLVEARAGFFKTR
jgi:hypothetical protein